MSVRAILWFVIMILVSGCASLKRDAGFEIETMKADRGGTEEPWHNVALRGDVSAVSGYTVAMIELPVPLPEVWKQEIADGRVYRVGNASVTFRRSVWRVALYGTDGRRQEVFDAVLNPSETTLFVLLPLGRVEEWKKGSWLVWLSDGKAVGTTRAAVVNVEGGVTGLSNQFFDTHPSPFPRYATLRRSDIEGRKFFESLERRFPVRLQMPDGGVFSAESDVIRVGALTKGDRMVDNLITCGSAVAVPSVTGMLVSAAFSLPHNISVITGGCTKKKGGAQHEATQAELLQSSSP